MNNIYSSRQIEKACKRDINFIWLLEGHKTPDHSTIARFRKKYLEDAIENLFFQLAHHLYNIGEIAFKYLFVDGTKIEANANRYTFVWKRVVNKNESKMFVKIISCIEGNPQPEQENKPRLRNFTKTSSCCNSSLNLQ